MSRRKKTSRRERGKKGREGGPKVAPDQCRDIVLFRQPDSSSGEAAPAQAAEQPAPPADPAPAEGPPENGGGVTELRPGTKLGFMGWPIYISAALISLALLAVFLVKVFVPDLLSSMSVWIWISVAIVAALLVFAVVRVIYKIRHGRTTAPAGTTTDTNGEQGKDEKKGFVEGVKDTFEKHKYLYVTLFIPVWILFILIIWWASPEVTWWNMMTGKLMFLTPIIVVSGAGFFLVKSKFTKYASAIIFLPGLALWSNALSQHRSNTTSAAATMVSRLLPPPVVEIPPIGQVQPKPIKFQRTFEIIAPPGVWTNVELPEPERSKFGRNIPYGWNCDYQESDCIEVLVNGRRPYDDCPDGVPHPKDMGVRKLGFMPKGTEPVPVEVVFTLYNKN